MAWKDDNEWDPWEPPAPEAPYIPPEPDPIFTGGVPPTPKPPDQPGGYWEQLPNGGWRFIENGPTPPPQPNPTYYGGGGGGGFGGISRPAMRSAPALGAYPMFDAPHYTKPPDFTYADFVAPTIEEAKNEPGYAFAALEGRKALENSAAGGGSLRTGQTMKDIYAWGNQFAEQNYGNVYNRAANTYGTNRNNAFQNYQLNLNAGLSAYDRLFQEASAEYAPRAREFELSSARDWDAFVYGADDEWRRYLADIDIAKTIYGGG